MICSAATHSSARLDSCALAQGANTRFKDTHGVSALDAAAGDDADARRALKREAAAQRMCACCGATPAEGVRLKRCSRCRLVQCECAVVDGRCVLGCAGPGRGSRAHAAAQWSAFSRLSRR